MRNTLHDCVLTMVIGAIVGIHGGCGSGDDEVESVGPADGGAAGMGEDASSDSSTSLTGGSAGVAGSPSDGGSAGAGAAQDSGTDADEADVVVEDVAVPSDATDVGVDAPVSTTCGDGIRDPISEECDDSNGITPPDSCDAECRVEDLFVHAPAVPDASTSSLTRRLGVGRHTVAAGDSGFAVVSVRTQPPPTTIALRAFDEKGTPGNVIEISDNSILMVSNPTVAALPGGKYALVYTDIGADGSNRGVALRVVDPLTQTVGQLRRVNTTTLGNQSDADVIWTGSDIVVAWVDESKLTSALLNTTLRRFSETGSSLGGEIPLGTAAQSEADVSLTDHNGTWAAAWRTYPGAGIPPVVTVRSGGTNWTTSLTSSGASDEKPALVSIDSTHLLAFFVDGAGGPVTQRVRCAILDSAAPGDTPSFGIEPVLEPYKSDPSLWQMHVTAVRAGDRVFAAWRSEPVIGSQDADEIWLKEITWDSSGGAFTLDLSSEEIPLPRLAKHRNQGQERPSLAVMTLPFENLLATAWDDHGKVFGPIEGQPDTVAELIPLPIVRLPDADGGLGK